MKTEEELKKQLGLERARQSFEKEISVALKKRKEILKKLRKKTFLLSDGRTVNPFSNKKHIKELYTIESIDRRIKTLRQTIAEIERKIRNRERDKLVQLARSIDIEEQIKAVNERSDTMISSNSAQIFSSRKGYFEFDCFISHASEDKVEIARPLAEVLQNMGIRIWYDEMTLKIGDSLREQIDTGLARSRYGVVIFSPNFFKKSWPRKELNALFSRQISEERVILPLWHNIDSDEMRNISPLASDIVAITTYNKSIAEIASRIRDSL